MEIEKAIEILHPDTTFQAITEIEYYGGFKGKEKVIEAINEACLVACECMEKQIPKEVVVVDYAFGETEYRCPSCSLLVSSTYCEECGQKIDWGLDD